MAKGLLKNAPKRKKRRTPQQFDEQYTGSEPDVEGTISQSQTLQAFNYYAYHKNIKDAKKYIVDYLLQVGSKDEARMVSNIWMARSNGIKRGRTFIRSPRKT